jgi:alpha-D-ribose 1-methylphosphonate 5-triphosphate synthase subunit PhnG
MVMDTDCGAVDGGHPRFGAAGGVPQAPGRRRWLGVLARAAGAELDAWFDAQPRTPAYQLLRAPETGIVMLRGRVGGGGDPFNLGEATVTRCTVRTEDGTVGTGYALGRDRRKAERIALLDALLQRDPACAADLIEQLAARQAAARDAASRAAASSRVEFFTVVRGA